MNKVKETIRGVGLAAVAVLLVGCGAHRTETVALSGPANDSGNTSSPSAPPPDDSGPGSPSAPPSDDSGPGSTSAPPPDGGGSTGKSVALPQLPIGGDAGQDDDNPANQCVDVSWIADHAEIPGGVHVKVTGAVFRPAIFEVAGSGCGGETLCPDYVFSTDDQECALAVEPNGESFDENGESPVVSLTGEVVCDDGGSSACTAFLSALPGEHNLEIGLEFPQPDTASSGGNPGDTSSDDTSSTDSSSDDSSSDDTGSSDGNPGDTSSTDTSSTDTSSDDSSSSGDDGSGG